MGNWYSRTETHGLGWVPDSKDVRDYSFCSDRSQPVTHFPVAYTLRDRMPPVLDQGHLGSCTANAIANAMRYCEKKEAKPDVARSRLFIYFNERKMEGTVGSDSGAQIRCGIKTINRTGACPESEWPYDVSKFTECPPEKAYKDAKGCRALKYMRVRQDLASIKHALISDYPVIFGFKVFSSMETEAVKSSGDIPLPDPKKGDTLLGGHCILIVGYREKDKRFLIQNSWGEDWGDAGFGTIPYDYVTNPELASDFWVVEFVSEK